jgi:hypothetical protein
MSQLLTLFALWSAAAACDAGDAAPATGSSDAPGPAAASRPATAPPAGFAWVIFGADTVLAEVAATADERAEGLMYRDDVPDGTGMLFVFQDSQIRSFWMANTYVALDIAYMDPAFRIVDIIAMEPQDTSSKPSRGPAMFALEVRQGWFTERDIAIGDQAEIVFGVRGR